MQSNKYYIVYWESMNHHSETSPVMNKEHGEQALKQIAAGKPVMVDYQEIYPVKACLVEILDGWDKEIIETKEADAVIQ